MQNRLKMNASENTNKKRDLGVGTETVTLLQLSRATFRHHSVFFLFK